MASQEIWGPSGEFCVIDNGTPPSATALNAGAPIGYDTLNNGTLSQGSNPFSNGNIPGYISSGATTVLNSNLSTRLLYRNPA